MDSKTLYQVLQAKYNLANYPDIFKTWLQYKQTSLSPYEEQIYSIIARAYIKLAGKPVQGMEEEIKANKNLQLQVKLFNKYLQPLLEKYTFKNLSENNLNQLIKEFYESKYEHNYSIALIEDYFSYYINDYKKLQANETQFKQSLELNLLTFFLYMKFNRPDLTEKQLKLLKDQDDEDVSTHLASIYYFIQIGNYQEAIIEIENIKEQYSEWTTKLINLKAFCLMHQRQFAEAKQLLLNLEKLMASQSSFNDEAEMEICLTNLIVISSILGEDEQSFQYLKELESLNPNALYFQKKREAIEKIQQAIETMNQ